MDKQKEEQQAFDMAKQDVPFLHHLKVIEHNDRPDFILEDENGRKIGLEHFRADVYRVQDTNSPHVSGGHTILNKAKCELFEKYHPFSVNDTWNDSAAKSASNDLAAYIKYFNIRMNRASYEGFDSFVTIKTCRCNGNGLQDIEGRKIGPDLSIEPLQKHFCFFDECSA